MPPTVVPELARRKLEAAWKKVADLSISAPTDAANLIRKVLSAKRVASSYILITGLLGKHTCHQVHPRSLQKGSSLPGAYDARSLCHKVVVPFEKTVGTLWGLSNEPLVGKAARHKEHDKYNPQLKFKDVAVHLHDVLEYAHTADAATVERMLVVALRLSKDLASRRVMPSIEQGANYAQVANFVREFLRETSGGARLVAVTGAFVTLLTEGCNVKVYPPNYSDKFAKTAGDIEVFSSHKLIGAYECKHRPLNLTDVQHGIGKARENGLSDYSFVYAAGLESGQKDTINKEIAKNADELDLPVIDIWMASPLWAALLNPLRRARFGEQVVAILREMMKLAEVANQAAELWNSLE